MRDANQYIRDCDDRQQAWGFLSVELSLLLRLQVVPGWNHMHIPADAETRNKMVTKSTARFSGTRENSRLMPLSVHSWKRLVFSRVENTGAAAKATVSMVILAIRAINCCTLLVLWHRSRQIALADDHSF